MYISFPSYTSTISYKQPSIVLYCAKQHTLTLSLTGQPSIVLYCAKQHTLTLTQSSLTHGTALLPLPVETCLHLCIFVSVTSLRDSSVYNCPLQYLIPLIDSGDPSLVHVKFDIYLSSECINPLNFSRAGGR